MLLSLLSQTVLLPCNWSITNYNCPLVISYKSASELSAILVLPCLDIITANNNVTALGGILLNFPCLL